MDLRKIERVVFSIMFLMAVFLPMLQTFFPIFPEIKSTERRTLAKRPEFSLSTIKEFPKKYESYFDDHFGFRNLLVHCYNAALVRSAQLFPLPVSSDQKVIIGKKGWLYYDSKESEGSLPDYLGRAPFSDEKLEQIRLNLESQRDWLKKNGIDFYVLVCPNKQSVYPEFLPDTIIKKKDAVTRLDQVIRYLQRHSDFQLIDVRQSLINGKKIHLTYYKSDTHWNRYGAFLAYQGLMRSMGIEPRPISDFKLSLRSRTLNKDLAKMLLIDPDNGTDIELSLRKSAPLHENKNKLLVFHDSFGHFLAQQLSNDFEKIVALHHGNKISTRYINFGKVIEIKENNDKRAFQLINFKTVVEKQPQTVLLALSERRLNVLVLPLEFA